MAPPTTAAGYVRRLAQVEFGEVKKLFIATTCLVAIGEGLHPREVLECLAETFADDDWDAIKDEILMRQWEEIGRGSPQ